MALKAALVNNPPEGEEGQLYREIGRSKPAPQGICVVNTAGKVLDWVLMFDDDKSVVAFLDHCQKRFARFPDAKQPVDAERYMRFPSEKMEDAADTRKPLPLVDGHAKGQDCPGTPPVRPGTLFARLFGRALDKDGKLMADTVRQEHYIEDRFDISVEMQERLAEALAEAGDKRFKLPEALARLLVSHAYLGQLDVNPVSAPGGKGSLKQCEIWAQKETADGRGSVRIRIDGRSEAAGASKDGQGGDGRLWEHEVKLTWDGAIEIDGRRVRRLLLMARGSEKLRWANERIGPWREADVTHLPGGHAIDLACGVRFGVIAEPAPAERVAADAPAPLTGRPVEPVPDEAKRQLVGALGPAFAIFRDRVQNELRLTDDQREKLRDRLAVTIQEAQQFFEKLDAATLKEREKGHAAYRERAQEKLAAFLEGALNKEQLKRFRQIELQHQGLFALMHPKIADDLKITAEQRQKFITIVKELQDKVGAVIREAEGSADATEVQAKLVKIRLQQERKLDAELTEAQKDRWKEMLGKRIDLSD